MIYRAWLVPIHQKLSYPELSFFYQLAKVFDFQEECVAIPNVFVIFCTSLITSQEKWLSASVNVQIVCIFAIHVSLYFCFALFAVCNLTHYLSGNSTGFASNDSSGAVGSVLIHKDEPTCFTYINLGKTLLLLTDGDCKL